MNTPLILAAPTPAGGITIPVTTAVGGLAGYTLYGLSGAASTLTVNGQPPSYPHTLIDGDLITWVRTDTSGQASVLAAGRSEVRLPLYGPLPDGGLLLLHYSGGTLLDILGEPLLAEQSADSGATWQALSLETLPQPISGWLRLTRPAAGNPAGVSEVMLVPPPTGSAPDPDPGGQPTEPTAPQDIAVINGVEAVYTLPPNGGSVRLHLTPQAGDKLRIQLRGPMGANIYWDLAGGSGPPLDMEQATAYSGSTDRTLTIDGAEPLKLDLYNDGGSPIDMAVTLTWGPPSETEPEPVYYPPLSLQAARPPNGDQANGVPHQVPAYHVSETPHTALRYAPGAAGPVVFELDNHPDLVYTLYYDERDLPPEQQRPALLSSKGGSGDRFSFTCTVQTDGSPLLLLLASAGEGLQVNATATWEPVVLPPDPEPDPDAPAVLLAQTTFTMPVDSERTFAFSATEQLSRLFIETPSGEELSIVVRDSNGSSTRSNLPVAGTPLILDYPTALGENTLILENNSGGTIFDAKLRIEEVPAPKVVQNGQPQSVLLPCSFNGYLDLNDVSPSGMFYFIVQADANGTLLLDVDNDFTGHSGSIANVDQYGSMKEGTRRTILSGRELYEFPLVAGDNLMAISHNGNDSSGHGTKPFFGFKFTPTW